MNPAGLLDYQIPAAEKLVSAINVFGAALDASEMGTGKTYNAGAVIRHYDCPTLVMCPEVTIPGWQRMGAAMGIEFSILNYEMLRTGRTPYGWWENPPPKRLPTKFKCTQCRTVVDPEKPVPCHLHHLGIHCVETETIPHDYGKFTWAPEIKLLVVDEAHRCSAVDSLHADMLIAAGRQKIKTLLLSATVAESPIQLRAIGFLLRLHNLIDSRIPGSPVGFYKWAMGLGCRKLPFQGFHFAVGEERRKEILSRLHSDIFTRRGCRVRIEDLGDAFPDCQVTAELYHAEKAGRAEELFRTMEEAIRTLNDIREGDPEHPLTVLLRASQEVELLKVPIFVELTTDALAEGKHVALFVNYRQTVEELCKRLKTQCRIDGSQTGVRGAKVRAANVEDFLHDREPVIVASAAAGGLGIGLHDILGRFGRLGLVSPGFSAKQFRQILGRLRRQGGKSTALYRAIFMAGTPDEKRHKALAAKLDCIDTLNDGDLFPNLVLTKFRERVIDLETDMPTTLKTFKI
jgi:hypothetical protein